MVSFFEVDVLNYKATYSAAFTLSWKNEFSVGNDTYR